jgi:hypothetical protein
MDADDWAPAVADADGDATTAVELIADALAEAAGVVSRDEGLVGVAAQAPTEIATKAATLAPTTRDEYRIERLLGFGCHGERPKFAGKGSIWSARRS